MEAIALGSVILNVILVGVIMTIRSREELAKPPHLRNPNWISPDDPRA